MVNLLFIWNFDWLIAGTEPQKHLNVIFKRSLFLWCFCLFEMFLRKKEMKIEDIIDIIGLTKEEIEKIKI